MSNFLTANEKIRYFLSPHCYDIYTGNTIRLTEPAADGYAELTCQLKRVTEYVCLKQSDTTNFLFIKNQRSADAAVLIPSSGNSYSVHLFEFKKTIDENKWQDVKEQLNCSWLRVKAICGMLDVLIDNVTCYTAFYRDSLSSNMALMKMPVGSAATSNASAAQFLIQRSEWIGNKISIIFYSKKVTHHKVSLNHAGIGSIGLAVP